MSIVEVRFGDIAGVLHRPPDATACVVLGHGFSAAVEAGLERYCARFAAVGFAALAFDYRRFGASGGEPREVLVVEDQLADWADALRFARSIEGIDRIAIWGTSYGGGHVLEAAARDGGVAAVVSQVPHTSGPATLRALGPRIGLPALAAGWLDRTGARLGLPPLYLPTVTGRSQRPNLADLYPGDAPVRHRVAARAYPELRGYSPGRAAAGVACPLLVQVAEGDEITPAAPAIAAARSAPRGELIAYPGRHFEVYLGGGFDRAVADQVAFLRRHLGAERGVHQTP